VGLIEDEVQDFRSHDWLRRILLIVVIGGIVVGLPIAYAVRFF
jgi:hypothetical protein